MHAVNAVAAKGFSMLQRTKRQGVALSEELLDYRQNSSNNDSAGIDKSNHSSAPQVVNAKVSVAGTPGSLESQLQPPAEQRRQTLVQTDAAERNNYYPGGLLLELRIRNVTLMKLSKLQNWDTFSDFLADVKSGLCDAANISQGSLSIHSIHESFTVSSRWELHQHNREKAQGANATSVKDNREVVVKMLLMPDQHVDASGAFDLMRQALNTTSLLQGRLGSMLWNSTMHIGVSSSSSLKPVGHRQHHSDSESQSLVPVIIFALVTTTLLCFCSQMDSRDSADGGRRTIRAGVRSNFA